MSFVVGIYYYYYEGMVSFVVGIYYYYYYEGVVSIVVGINWHCSCAKCDLNFESRT